MYLCWTEVFEIELIICIKMDLALNNLLGLIFHKTQPTNQPTTHLSLFQLVLWLATITTGSIATVITTTITTIITSATITTSISTANGPEDLGSIPGHVIRL